MFKNAKKQVYRVIVAQIIVVSAISLVWLLIRDFRACFSAFSGGVACILPSIFFVLRLFRDKQRTPRQVVVDFYLGELIKLVLSVVLLILILRLMPVKLLPLLTGYIGAYLSVWLMPVLNALGS